MTLVARHAARSDIGLHRKTNEDAVLAAPPLFVVCDGMGGARAGEVASRLAVETLAAALAGGRTLLAAAEEANAAVHAQAAADPERSGMGTTLTALTLEGDTAHFVHIGDSRAYVLRAGELEQISEDHSLVGQMVRDGRLTAEEAAVHPHRSILSRALGTEPQARFDEFAVDLLPGDVLLLCSDGLSGVVPATAIAGGLEHQMPEDAAEELVAAARAAGAPDNISAVVLRFAAAPEEGDGAEAPAAASLGDGAPPVPASGGPDAGVVPAGGVDPGLPGDGERPAGDLPGGGSPAAGSVEAPAGASGSEVAGDGAPPVPSRRRLGCLAAALGLLAVIAAAGALAFSTVFFVGVDDGRLAIYSGLPVQVGPLQLHAIWRKSARPYASLSEAERRVVDARGLHGEDGVMALSSALGMWP
ncbi:MAG: protein phosphatase 2C domain-containing protein [Thermoleophilia bacterium]